MHGVPPLTLVDLGLIGFRVNCLFGSVLVFCGLSLGFIGTPGLIQLLCVHL